MLNKIYDWVDERLDITPIWRDIADHEVPEHVNPAHHFSAFVYCFGGLTFFVTVIQILSGMFLTMYYVPDIKNAWESVYYLQNEVAYGQIVRGMHHWGASLVIVMMFLHTLRVFFQGAYKKPREPKLDCWCSYFLCYARSWFYRIFITVGYESVICYESRDSNCRANAAHWSLH